MGIIVGAGVGATAIILVLFVSQFSSLLPTTLLGLPNTLSKTIQESGEPTSNPVSKDADGEQAEQTATQPTPEAGANSESNPDESSEEEPPVMAGESDELKELRQYALDLINEDREKHGVPPVALSDNIAAQIHAEELIETRRLSHWTTDGMKPYMRYSLYDGSGDIAQNAAIRYTVADDPFSSARVQACKKGMALCILDIKDAIKQAQHDMMYDDAHSDWGHRDNILDKYHTHVSIGIAFDGADFGFIQNFENQYVEWQRRITYDPAVNTLHMSGELDDGLKLYTINVFYDPLPTPNTYEENLDKESYDNGVLEATIAKPAPFGYRYEESGGVMLVEATKWELEDDSNQFDIAFSLDRVTNQYGDGVYTIVVWASDVSGEHFPITNHSVFLDHSRNITVATANLLA